MSEKWEKLYSKEDIKKIQNIELNSLKVFMEVCNKLEIDFILYGGTLLGAIKYKGFIPWDDDLDVALMRKDYEKFLKYAPSMISNEYEIQHPTINRFTPFAYIKFRRKNTMLVEYSLHKIKINHGVYFDIYPIDNIPDDDELMFKQNMEIKKLIKIFIYRQNKYLSRPIKGMKDLIKMGIKGLISIILKLIPLKYFNKKMYQIMTRYNDINTKRQGNYFFPKPVNFFDGVYPLVDVNFEGLVLKAPTGYKMNLLNRYGDISKLPPEKERIGHKAYILKL